MKFLRRALAAGLASWLSWSPAIAADHDALTLTVRVADVFAPEAVQDLDVLAGSEGQALLSWTAPEEDSGVVPTGQAVSSYEIYAATIPLVDWIALGGSSTSWLTFASALPGPPPPLGAGNPQSYLANLAPGATYYFALRSRDDASLYSPLDSLALTPNQAKVFLPSGGVAAVPTLSVSSVTDQSITLSWSANGNGAGTLYELERSPSPSGPWFQRANTTALSYTDLVPESALFYYRVRAKNTSNVYSAYDGPVSTASLSVPPGPASSFTLTVNTSAGKRIDISWTNPSDADLAGILIVRATAPVSFTPQQFTAYAVGQSVGNGVVAYNSIAAPQAFTDTGLTPFTTYYYAAFTRDEVPNYGAPVSASAMALPAIDNVRPGIPGGFSAVRFPDGTGITLTWIAVTVNDDAGKTPIDDLTGYRVIRSTVLGGAEDIRAFVSPATLIYTDTISPDTTYFYKLRAVDFSGNESIDSAILETSQAPKTFIIKGATLISLKGEASQALLAENNPLGVDINIVSQAKAEEQTGNILRSIVIEAQNAATGSPIRGLTFKPEDMEIIFSYEASSFPVGAFGIKKSWGLQAQASPGTKSPATVAVYWNNGLEWVNIHGQVDESLKTIAVKQPNLGAFQVRRYVQGSGFSLDAANVRPRIITPNGDGKNDVVIFYFDNPNNSPVTGKILDVNGARVADINKPGPIAGITMIWDGRDFNGNVVPMGIYVYRLQAEGRSFTGTVVVAR